MSNRVQVQYDIEVPKAWLEFCRSSDLFLPSYCGYWMYGAKLTDKRGWLVFEHGDDHPGHNFDSTKEFKTAVRLWRTDETLPEGWYRFTDAAMIHAYRLGCELWGRDWYQGRNSDASGYDALIQRTLLGEERYG